MVAESMVLRWADAAAAWLLTYMVHSTLLIVSVWLVTSRKSLRDATRDVLWKAALVGGLITASVQSALSHEPLGGQLRLDALRSGEPKPVRVAVRTSPHGNAERVVVAQRKGTRWTSGVVVLWVTGAGAALLWLTWAHARAVAAFADRTSLDDTPIALRLRALLARSGVRRDVELTCSANLASPVALVNGEVCLPRRALVELDGVEQESMLAHEIAHVVRRDPQWLVVARVIEAVLFMQPLNRLVRRRVQSIAEFLCDDWAVQRTSQPVTLAKCLAAVAEWVGRAPRLHAMSAMVESAGSPLVQRVRRILGGGHARRSHSARGALSVSWCALIVLAGVAPRVSVGGEAMKHRTIMFVRAIIDREGTPRASDTVVFAPSSAVRVELDSLMRRTPQGRAVAGGIIERRDIVIRRISGEALVRDSVAGRLWTRPLPAASGAAVGSLPFAGAPRARVIRMEMRD